MIDLRLLKDHDYSLVAAEDADLLPKQIPMISLAVGAMAPNRDLLPYLIDLKALDDTVRLNLLVYMQDQLDQGDNPVIKSLIKTRYDTSQIKSYFAKAQVCKNKDNDTAWLRIHDPRVWIHLERSLTKNIFLAFMSPVQRWTIFYDDEWISHNFDELLDSSMPKFSPTVNHTAWKALGRIGLVNRSLQRLELSSYQQAVKYSATLDSAVERGQSRHQLESIDDIVEYACLSWHIHPRFDEHELALNAVRQYQSEIANGEPDSDVSIADVFSAIERSKWPLMRNELKAKF
jgi:hypothetical protein